MRTAMWEARAHGSSTLERAKAALIHAGREAERSWREAEAIERRHVSSARQTYEWDKRVRVDALWMRDRCIPPEQVRSGVLHPSSGVRKLIGRMGGASPAAMWQRVVRRARRQERRAAAQLERAKRKHARELAVLAARVRGWNCGAP